MLTRARKFLAVVGVGGLMLLGSATPAAATSRSQDDGDRNANLRELTADWWQWSIAIPLAEHPFSDPPAHDCTFAQSGKTWFLGAVFNATGTAVRQCTVPVGTRLLIPALNVECSNVEADPFHAETAAKQKACARSFRMTDIRVTLDGRAVPVTYVVSPQFTFEAPADNLLGVTGPISGTSVSAGWWALLRPSEGKHVVKFGGRFPDFNVAIDITYVLRVV